MNFLELTTSNLAPEFPKCFSCKNPLSYLPIYVSSENKNLCGRCTPSTENTYIRNVAYETISQFLKFPCRYRNEGCAEKVLPKDVQQHEKVCAHRIVNCPAEVNKCDWMGPCYNLLEHCRSKHCEDVLQDGEFEMNLSSSNEVVKFVECDKGLFVAFLKYMNKILQCAICDFKNENLKCQITVTCGEKSISEVFNTTHMDNIKFTDLNLEHFSSVCGKINIGNSVDDDKINYEMLSLLKCYICSDFTLPPVYQCSKNHSTVCFNCREQHSSECDCWIQFGQAIRNISLDNIASLLNYPCKNRKNGCCFISKPDEMKTHQQCCHLEEIKCPVHEYIECTWKGISDDLLTHVEEIHQDIIFSNYNKFSLSNLTSKHTHCYLIHYANHWFLLVFMKMNNSFYWTVQMVGPIIGNFRFEIEVLDKNDNGRLLTGNSCSPLISRNQLFKNSDYYCYLCTSQIRWFTPDSNTVTFRVRIVSY